MASVSKPVGLGRLDEKDAEQDQNLAHGAAAPPPAFVPPGVATSASSVPPLASPPAPPLTRPPITPPGHAPSTSTGPQPAHPHVPLSPTVKSDLHLLLPGLVGRKTRVPRGFRLDADLIEYLELHEMYRTALGDQRSFTEKLNDWIRQRLAEDTPVLIRAAEALREVRDQEKAYEQPESGDSLVGESELQAPSVEADDTSVPANGHAVAAAAAESPGSSQRRGPSIRELEKQLRTSSRSGGSAGTL